MNPIGKVRIVLEVKENPYSALKKLYERTPLKITFNVANLALVNKAKAFEFEGDNSSLR